MPIPARNFYFLRHGQTDWNVQGRFQGHIDIPLNERGLSQANAAAAALVDRGIEIIVASPLVRALKTAAIVGERLGLPIFIDSELKERHFGVFEGRIVNEVKQELGVQPHERLVHLLPESAEPWHETGSRTTRVIGRWLDKYPQSKILFVAHSGLFDALHDALFGTRAEAKHEPYVIEHGDKGWTCRLLSEQG